MIGSNTRCYYHFDGKDTNCEEIGRFLMINGMDTIPSLYGQVLFAS